MMSKEDDAVYAEQRIVMALFQSAGLEEAQDESVPLLERMKFVSIFHE